MSLCPLCNQRIEGDEAFVNYHVNKCIESGSGGQAEASSSSNSRDKGRSGVEEEEKGRKELLRQQEEADAEVARALMMTEQAVVQSGGTILSVGGSMEVDDDDEEEGEGDEGPQCPICFLPWSQLGVELGNEMGMATHAQICLEGGSGEGYQDEDDEDEDDEGEEEDELFAGIIGSGVGKSRIGFGNAANSRAIIGIPGIIPILKTLLSRSHKDGKISVAWLCSSSIEFVATRFADAGWGCGYRNTMMIYTSLRKMDSYSSSSSSSSLTKGIPTINEIQSGLEAAWKNGYDKGGAEHFNYKILNRRKWIGASDVYTYLSYIGVRARLVDFPKQKGIKGQDTHTALIRWIKDYFNSPLDPTELSKKRPNDVNTALMSSGGVAVRLTKKQPLYLQHHGHSRTIVGIETSKDGAEWLLVYDPSKPPLNAVKEAAENRSSSSSSSLEPPNKKPKLSASSSSSSPSSSSSYAHLKLPQSFINAAPGGSLISTGKGKIVNKVSVWSGGNDGFYSSSSGGGGGGGGGGMDLSDHAKWLRSFRVDLKSLKRNTEYQIVYVEEGPPLSPQEKVRRKVVTSLDVLQ